MSNKTRKQEEQVAPAQPKELETAYVTHPLAQLLASRLAAGAVPTWPGWLR
jgi:hypothetical protein